MPKISAMRQLIKQSEAAGLIMDEFTTYARKIGCQVEGDSIMCTTTQDKLLKLWWKARTHGFLK